MNFSSAATAHGTTGRTFIHTTESGDVPGVLWTPADASAPAPLVLHAHGGGQHKLAPGVADRAARCAAAGLAVAALDAPGHGDRPRSSEDNRFAAEIRARLTAGQDVAPLAAEYNASLAGRAVPEWRSVLDALLKLPEIDGGGVGFWGMSMGSAVGIPLVAAEPRVRAAVFGLVGRTDGLARAAAGVTVPVRFLLQWDDRLVARESGLAMFDALRAPDKTLHANPGGHGDVPELEIDDAVRFLSHHLARRPRPA